MMTRKDITNEEELKAWADEPEEEILAKNDVASVAAEALERISGHLGEKTTIACSSILIHESVNNKANWEFRAMGYMFLGMIAESCTKTFKKNLDDTIRMNAMGLIDAHLFSVTPHISKPALDAAAHVQQVSATNAQKGFVCFCYGEK